MCILPLWICVAFSSQTTKSEKGHSLDGHSLRPLLANPSARWDGAPALTAVFAGSASESDPSKQHYAIRTDRYRYILYASGKEELYDHKKDPYEWTNISGKRKALTKKMRKELASLVEPFELEGLKQVNTR